MGGIQFLRQGRRCSVSSSGTHAGRQFAWDRRNGRNFGKPMSGLLNPALLPAQVAFTRSMRYREEGQKRGVKFSPSPCLSPFASMRLFSAALGPSGQPWLPFSAGLGRTFLDGASRPAFCWLADQRRVIISEIKFGSLPDHPRSRQSHECALNHPSTMALV